MKIMTDVRILNVIFHKFIDSNKSYYAHEIARRHDDGTYEWYLWNCLMDPVVVTYEWIKDALSPDSEVFIFWDENNKSKFRFDRAKYKLLRTRYDLCVMLCMRWSEFPRALRGFPDDFYIVDIGLTKLYAITHEYIDWRRYCLSSVPRGSTEN